MHQTITDWLSILWIITLASYLLIMYQMLIYSRGIFKETYGKRVSLRIINNSLKVAVEPEAIKKLKLLRVNYWIFLVLFYTSIVLFIISLIAKR